MRWRDMNNVSESIRDRAKGLLVRYRSDSGDPDLNMDSLIAWLDERVTVHGIGMTTAKCYRRWLAAYIESTGHPEATRIRDWLPPGSHEAALKADAVDASELGPYMVIESTPTNSRYFAYLDSETVNELIDDLAKLDAKGNPRYASGHSAAMFFTATMMVGLRPAEWPTARYHEVFFDPSTKLTLGPVLEVMTLKQDKRREDNPLREKRYLLLDELKESQLQHIRAFLSEVDAQGDRFQEYYDRVRKALSRSWQRIVKRDPERFVASVRPEKGKRRKSKTAKPQPTSVSLYTARHIFAEEIRRSQRYTRFELAAMLGHTMLTNQVYYGPRDGYRERGHGYTLPRPWPGDAEDIKQWDKQTNPLRSGFAQGDLFGSMDSGAPTLEENRDGISGFYLR